MLMSCMGYWIVIGSGAGNGIGYCNNGDLYSNNNGTRLAKNSYGKDSVGIILTITTDTHFGIH
jgi:hypothetical protein